MPKRDSARVWKKRVHEGREVLKRWVKRSDPYVRAYCGKFPASLTGDASENVESNYVLATTRALVSSLFFRNPKVSIPPQEPKDMQEAYIAEGVLNKVLAESKVEDAFQSAMRDAILRGGGWVKFGYHTESAPKFDEDVVVNSADEDVHRENEKLLMNMEVEPNEDENHDKHIASHQALLDDPAVLTGLMQQFGEEAALRLIGHIEEHRRLKEQVTKAGKLDWRVEPENVWCRYVDARDVVIDPNATTLDDARWIAFRTVRTLGDVKRDPAYKNTSSLHGTTATPHQDFDGEIAERKSVIDVFDDLGHTNAKDGDDTDPDDVRLELFEIWDRQTERILVVTDQSDRFLRDEPSPYLRIPGFWPATHLVFNEKPGHGGEDESERPYGYSHIEPFWGEQLELNAFESIRLAIGKHNVPKYEADSSISDTSLKEITYGRVGAVIKIDRGDPNASNQPGIRPINLQKTSIDIHAAIQNLRDSISLTFALYDTSRQIVDNVKAGQPLQAQLDEAALRGAKNGAIFKG